MNTTKPRVFAGIVLGVLAFGSTAQAHEPNITASCEAGLDVVLSKYSGTDHVDVWVDHVRLVHTAFTHDFTFYFDFDQTVSHTFHVEVYAQPENSPDVHGKVPACVVPETTTTEAPTTTVADTTTTVATTLPAPAVTDTGTPVVLPSTGAGTWSLIATGFVLLAIGATLLWSSVKLRRHVRNLK